MDSRSLYHIIFLLLGALALGGWADTSEAEDESPIILKGARANPGNYTASKTALSRRQDRPSSSQQAAQLKRASSISKPSYLDVRARKGNSTRRPKYVGASKEYSPVVLEGSARNKKGQTSRLVESHNITEAPPTGQTTEPLPAVSFASEGARSAADDSELARAKQKLLKLQEQLKLLRQGRFQEAEAVDSGTEDASQATELVAPSLSRGRNTLPGTSVGGRRTDRAQSEIIVIPELPAPSSDAGSGSTTALDGSFSDKRAAHSPPLKATPIINDTAAPRAEDPNGLEPEPGDGSESSQGYGEKPSRQTQTPSAATGAQQKPDKTQPRTSMAAADSFYRARKWKLALAAYESIDTEHAGDDVKLWRDYQIANCYRALKDFSKAKEKYRELITKDPQNFWAKQAKWFYEDAEWWERWVEQRPPARNPLKE